VHGIPIFLAGDNMNAALPQQATQDTAAWDNPMGTDGFEFIEYAAPDPAAMGKLFETHGLQGHRRHRHKNVTLYRQGEVNFIINAEPDSASPSASPACTGRACAPSAFRVQDAKLAYERALSLGAWGFDNKTGPMELNIPAIKGIGDSLIYFVDRWRGKDGAQPGASATSASLTWTSCPMERRRGLQSPWVTVSPTSTT
jgi:4-hydroxyphenylpyruvate dioxygenase